MLAGAEVDILSDGRLDLADDCLAALDIVIASLHSQLQQEEAETTRRLIRAIEHPSVDILGHPTARMLLRREGAKFTLEKVIDAAVANGVALEINSQPHRLDLCDSHARLARDRGAKLALNSDAHEIDALGYTRWGILTARRAWLTKDDVHQHPAAEAVPRPACEGIDRPRTSDRRPIDSPMDAIDEIKRLYYEATKATIRQDIERAIDLLKSLPDDDARQRAAVYMDGLSQMRSEWAQAIAAAVSTSALDFRFWISHSASAPPTGAPRGRSGRVDSFFTSALDEPLHQVHRQGHRRLGVLHQAEHHRVAFRPGARLAMVRRMSSETLPIFANASTSASLTFGQLNTADATRRFGSRIRMERISRVPFIAHFTFSGTVIVAEALLEGLRLLFLGGLALELRARSSTGIDQRLVEVGRRTCRTARCRA